MIPVAVLIYALFLKQRGWSIRRIALSLHLYLGIITLYGNGMKKLRNTFASKCSVSMYLVGDRKAWIIVAYEPFHKKLLGIWLTSEKKDHIIACFLKELVKRFGRHPVYTDGALYHDSTCRIIGLEHHVYTFGS